MVGREAFTTNNIIRDASLINVVIHDAEGDWQFLSNVNADASQPALTTIGQLAEMNSAILDVLGMDVACKAELVEGGTWSITRL